MRFVLLFLMLVYAAPCMAQGAGREGDMDRRIALATRMVDLSPPRPAVDAAIESIVSRASPEDRAREQQAMTAAFDYAGLRQIAITRMSGIFTVDELQKMVDYNASPEGQSIARKMPAYQVSLQPDMTRLLDVALMVARTGPGAKPAAAPK